MQKTRYDRGEGVKKKGSKIALRILRMTSKNLYILTINQHSYRI